MQLTDNADPGVGRLQGRALHMESGDSVYFDDVRQLFAFFAALVRKREHRD